MGRVPGKWDGSRGNGTGLEPATEHRGLEPATEHRGLEPEHLALEHRELEPAPEHPGLEPVTEHWGLEPVTEHRGLEPKHRGVEPATEHWGQEPVTEHRGLEQRGLEPRSLTQGPGGTPGGTPTCCGEAHHGRECKEFTFRFADGVRRQRFGAVTPGYDFLLALR
ncbi:Patatin-like phospholipase domain-containing protein 4 [Liparis tanakae]|uniref:Patatin-like phospholipase domain-containing protein 4 n=1 Tax=Liparis tanakae TaxID=230148 RepID=A0A4Z2F2Z6_9TELE|nr:Patatin-like phospholipase domain-containing protein 4 [Liparis tanakae]